MFENTKQVCSFSVHVLLNKFKVLKLFVSVVFKTYRLSNNCFLPQSPVLTFKKVTLFFIKALTKTYIFDEVDVFF